MIEMSRRFPGVTREAEEGIRRMSEAYQIGYADGKREAEEKVKEVLAENIRLRRTMIKAGILLQSMGD